MPLTQDAVTQFRSQLRGEVIEPGDAAYEEARKVYNGMIDKKPRLIAKCVDVADVMTAVKFGRAQSIRVSIRGGGHNAGGLGIADDALVITSIPRRVPCGSAADAFGATSITPPTHSDSQCLPALSAPPESAASPWAAGSDT
jgi:hypothetical protein